jgi:predicted lysophospholipase L1 biosynthesis ABC-type transport system permease subunit
MFRRAPMRRGGLVRAAATTAVVAGTATAVSGRVAHRQDQKYQTQQQEAMAQDAAVQSQQEIADLQAQMAAMQAQQVQAAAPMPQYAPAPAAAGGSDMMGQLQQLAQMKQNGLLSEEEFQAAKARLLGG